MFYWCVKLPLLQEHTPSWRSTGEGGAHPQGPSLGLCLSFRFFQMDYRSTTCTNCCMHKYFENFNLHSSFPSLLAYKFAQQCFVNLHQNIFHTQILLIQKSVWHCAMSTSIVTMIKSDRKTKSNQVEFILLSAQICGKSLIINAQDLYSIARKRHKG